MSRIGRMPIAIPAGVTVEIAENNKVTVKGPKGTLESRDGDQAGRRRDPRKQTKRLEEDAFTSWSYKNSHSQHGNRCN